MELYSNDPEIACPQAAEDIKALVRFAAVQALAMSSGDAALVMAACKDLPEHLRRNIDASRRDIIVSDMRQLTEALTPAQSATPPAEADEAVIELRQAIEGGHDMPWSMVGIRWTTAKRLLEMVEVSHGERT